MKLQMLCYVLSCATFLTGSDGGKNEGSWVGYNAQEDRARWVSASHRRKPSNYGTDFEKRLSQLEERLSDYNPDQCKQGLGPHEKTALLKNFDGVGVSMPSDLSEDPNHRHLTARHETLHYILVSSAVILSTVLNSDIFHMWMFGPKK